MFCFVLFLLRVGDVALFGFVHVPAPVLHQLFCCRINIPTQTLSWGPNLKKKNAPRFASGFAPKWEMGILVSSNPNSVCDRGGLRLLCSFVWNLFLWQNSEAAEISCVGCGVHLVFLFFLIFMVRWPKPSEHGITVLVSDLVVLAQAGRAAKPKSC